LSTNEIPPGRVPVLASDGVGEPVAVTINVPAAPTVNVVLFGLVIAGALVPEFTVRVKFWVASGGAALCALKTIL
jgi:hypothetical protein